MSLKSLFNSLTGQTSSSKVEIIERTHFNGKVLKKVIIVEETEEIKRKEAKKADSIFPKEAPHKPFSSDYKFSFILDLTARPEGDTIRELVEKSLYTNYYKPLLEVYKPHKPLVTSLPAESTCTRFIGFKLNEWLEIKADQVFEGELIDYYPTSMNLFPMTFEEIFVVQNDGNFSLQTRRILVEEFQLNRAIQQIVLWETSLFAKECLKIMSPR